MDKTCKHGIALEKAIASPPRMTGCVVCHNLPTTLNWNPYSWPLKKYDNAFGEQAFDDINMVLDQREEWRRRAEKAEAELVSLKRRFDADEIEASGANHRVDEDTGKPYWELWGEGWKDSEDMGSNKPIKYDPRDFPPGTRIVVIEPAPETPSSARFYGLADGKKFYPVKEIPLCSTSTTSSMSR